VIVKKAENMYPESRKKQRYRSWVVLCFVCTIPFFISGCSSAKNMFNSESDKVKKSSTIGKFGKIEGYPIRVEVRPVMVELPAAGMLSDRDTARIAEMAKRWNLQGYGNITIAWPSALDVYDTVRSIANTLVFYGVRPDFIAQGPYTVEERNSNSIFIWYKEVVAMAPACEGIPALSVNSFSNSFTDGHGCATQKNLAAMIADPRNLLVPAPREVWSLESRIKAALKTGR
jgi:pilus assembly protein CpaD